MFEMEFALKLFNGVGQLPGKSDLRLEIYSKMSDDEVGMLF